MSADRGRQGLGAEQRRWRVRGAAHAGMEHSFPEDAVGVGARASRRKHHSTALPRPGASRAGFVLQGRSSSPGANNAHSAHRENSGHANSWKNYVFCFTDLLGKQTNYQRNHRKVHIPWPLLKTSQTAIQAQCDFRTVVVMKPAPRSGNLTCCSKSTYITTPPICFTFLLLVSFETTYFNIICFPWNPGYFIFMHWETLFWEGAQRLYQRPVGNPAINQ